MDYKRCPECHSVANSGQSFRLFECKDCGRRYCYRCSGSNDGKRCPKCKCSDYREVGRVVS